MTRADTESLSAACEAAQKPGYEQLHGWCRQNRDIPLPHSKGKILLVRRCHCSCHRRAKSTS